MLRLSKGDREERGICSTTETVNEDIKRIFILPVIERNL